MFSRDFRLPGHRLPSLLNSKKYFSSPLFIIKINQIAQPTLQIGIVVSTKISRLAVTRNRLRRLTREALIPFLAKIKTGHELLFLAKPAIVKQSILVIQADILKLLKSCSLLN